MYNPMIEIAGNLGAGINQGVMGVYADREREAERKKKEAQERLAIIQKLGQVAQENKDGQAMAGFANQMPGLLKEGYGIDAPNQKLVGEPVMARGMERPFIEHQGPSPVPGQKVGVMSPTPVPTPYEYDTGERNLDNPRTLDQARRGLMLAAPKSTIVERDPYKVWVDETTGKVVHEAEKRPAPAARQFAPPAPQQDPVTGEWFTPKPGLKTHTKPGAAAKPERVNPTDARTWSQHIADFGRDFPGVTITSTRRTPAHNAKVGGVPGSYHTKGMAFDAVPPAMAEPAIRQWAAERGMEIVVEDPGTPNYHWHFEPRGGVPASAKRPPRIAGGKPAKGGSAAKPASAPKGMSDAEIRAQAKLMADTEVPLEKYPDPDDVKRHAQAVIKNIEKLRGQREAGAASAPLTLRDQLKADGLL